MTILRKNHFWPEPSNWVQNRCEGILCSRSPLWQDKCIGLRSSINAAKLGCIWLWWILYTWPYHKQQLLQVRSSWGCHLKSKELHPFGWCSTVFTKVNASYRYNYMCLCVHVHTETRERESCGNSNRYTHACILSKHRRSKEVEMVAVVHYRCTISEDVHAVISQLYNNGQMAYIGLHNSLL